MHPQSTPALLPVDETVTRIPLRRIDGTIAAYALVDAADAAFANQWRWHWGRRYVVRTGDVNGRKSTISLHRELLGLPRVSDGREGDHINHDTLDNRRSNLRVVPPRRNQQNQSARAGTSSQYRGVAWSVRAGAWDASVGMDGHRYHLGNYATELDAARAAARWRAEHMPMAVEDPALLAGPPPQRLVREQARGERHGHTRLTAAQVREVRARYAAGEATFTELGAEYGVSPVCIRDIVKRRTWGHMV